MAKKIFIAATQQNDGKTTVSLGLIAALKKRFERIGFIKPIGQRYLMEQGYRVDEDSVLIEEVFGIKCNIKDMSPVAIDKGFTERFIEKGADEDYAKLIKDSFEHVAKDNDLVIIEGTGHAGVGSVFGLSNATVARLLDTNIILISSGGVGKPIDEVMLNKALLDKEGVNLAGVIVNKVLPEKYDRISRLARKGLEQKGLAVFGMLPYQKILDIPTMREIKEELKLEALYVGKNLDKTAENVLIGAMNVKDAIGFIQNNSLMIIPGDRDDMIETVCKVHAGKIKKGCSISGMILSGGLMPKRKSLEAVEKSGISALITKEDTYKIASRVNSMIVKLKPQDTHKIKIIVDMVEKYIDIEKVLANLK
ncbi:MAG: AAA family ATPase [Candidatus Omnitrophica bacterium]|nr:AAA family ATPase [Candidatus Omnitrophota bacterium]